MLTLFVVGMPRSGTKLLRDLLNSSPDIAIFPHESHVIPLFDRTWAQYGDMSLKENFAAFHADFSATVFATRMARRGIRFDLHAWERRFDGREFGQALQALFELYSEMTKCRVVGDKTPSYLVHAPLLLRLLPDSRFIHIVRDPRDYAVSVTRAWGKGVVRAAQRWKDQIRTFSTDVANYPGCHLTVRYEDLLTDTEATIRSICRFLGVPYVESMLKPSETSEQLGRASGLGHVLRDNHGRWSERLTTRELRQIESICGNLMLEYGYQPEIEAGDQNVPPWRMEYFRVMDGLKLLDYHRRECGGFIPALRHMRQVAAESALEE